MEHDTLAKRLGLILTRLNTGESLTLASLAIEFNVTERTLQRDFNERLNYLPIKRKASTYFMDPKYLGRQGYSDIKSMLDALGLNKIFPSFDALSFNRLEDSKVAPFLFRDMKIEDDSGYEETFKSLTLAIQNNQIVRFLYKCQTYLEVQSYRLVNDRGWWHLAAIHNGTLKSFKVPNISKVYIANQHFKRLKKVNEQISDGSMIWLTGPPIEVVLRIDSTIASHFKETDIFREQHILKILGDGSLLATSSITDQKQIIPILKYWLPDIEVLWPTALKQTLMYDLQHSIDRMSI